MKRSISIGVVMLMAFAMLIGAAGFAAAEESSLININTADKETLMQLDGVGESYAQRIIDYRETNGPFANTTDIQNVKGIGAATYNKCKDMICVQQP
ncbi:MAG: helix-hairpin-helix domain-containing protein [Deltaproteobacteria bacterium]|nr:helix-hairpin-helix domain-containing protein [Deltaproteobacteria bacterium]